MNKVRLTLAAFAFGMLSVAPAFADDMTATAPAAPAVTCTCPQEKACKDASAIDCCKPDLAADDCTKWGGTLPVTGDMHDAAKTE